MNKSALNNQKGFAASPILIIGVVVVVLIIIGIASGGLKGSFKVTVDDKSTPPAEESTQETTPQETPTPTPSSTATFKTYTSEEMNIAFEYPEDWTVKETSDTITIALIEEGTTNNAAAAITAINRPLGSAKGLQFASVVDLQKVALKKEFNTSEFTVDEATKIGDKEARLLGFEGNISGNTLTGRYLTTIDENNIYAMTVLADADKWSKYSADLQKTLDSFKLLK